MFSARLVLVFAVVLCIQLCNASWLDERAMTQEKRCNGKYQKCTSNSQCCDQKDYAKRKLRCLTQCDEGGCMKYKQCMFYAGTQK
uniref:Toxin NvePTx1 n=1 Tax=Nematostella vectensis TaxID=45351 RepID=KV51_NEMVE|nr:RecName: Full=Toxin NvePTx1; Flags: Precursor [Nematostella vectensis]